MRFSLRYVSLEFIDPLKVHSLHASDVSPLRTTAERWETRSQSVMVALTLDLLSRDAFAFCSGLLWGPLLN